MKNEIEKIKKDQKNKLKYEGENILKRKEIKKN